jgi:hypothetical protein
MPDFVTCALIYFAVGAVTWALISVSGILEELDQRMLSRGKPVTMETHIQTLSLVLLKWPMLWFEMGAAFLGALRGSR